MDNFEDICVENNRKTLNFQSENQAKQWFQIWSEFIQEKPFSWGENSEVSTKIIQELLEASQQGDSCITVDTAALTALNGLALAGSQVTAKSVAPFIYDDQYLYLYRYWRLEQQVSQHVLRLKQQPIDQVDLTPYSNLLSDLYQRQALEMVAQTGFSIITGGPGTGKTYTLARIIAVLYQHNPNIRIAMAAPTGKAAQRMKEALQHSFSDEKLISLLSEELRNLVPVTIHRLLGLGNSTQPRFHEKQPLPYDVIVVDEASMLDLNLAKMLFAAVPDQARLILLGDANQLASVDVGAVLADLQQVESLKTNRVSLVTSRRFQEGALIGKMAKFIQQEHVETSDEKLLAEFHQQIVMPSALQEVDLKQLETDQIQLEYLAEHMRLSADLTAYYDKLMLGYHPYVAVIQRYLQHIDIEAMRDKIIQVFDQYRILTAIRHGALGLTQLNIQIEQRFLADLKLIKRGDWYMGRPVMMTYNDYQLGLSNGDIGICLKRTDQASAPFEVYFPSLEKWVLATRLPKNIETAFVLTIHKSQGSEFTHTAVVLDQKSENLLSKELIYTAITRAKKVVSLLVSQNALLQSLKIRTTRKSGLVKKLN